MPQLSVVMPVYNAEHTLAQAIDSVLRQSLQDIELICVDDGSTDASLDILNEYAAHDARVRVLHQQNLHAGPARNAGLDVATGDYIHFLDADDYVLPYAYEALYNKAVKYDLDVLRCAAVNWDEQRECFVESRRENLTLLRPGDFNRLVGVEENSPLYKVSVAPWAGLYRRSFLDECHIRFTNLTCCNDRSFFMAVITNAKRCMVARDRVICYRMNQGASLIDKRAKYFDCHFQSIEAIVERMKNDGVALEVQERVLQQEFSDVCVWFERLANDEEYGQLIQTHMQDFVQSYTGPFRHHVITKYRDALRAVERAAGAGVPASKPAREVKVMREAVEAPKVSVVVPIYNVEDYLNEALYSLEQQTLQSMEFILVNDGSTDGSLTIMKEYAAPDKRFRILDGPNGGYGKAMNRGIDAARGEYLGILEPDDFVPKGMFKGLYSAAKKNKVEFVKADFYRFKVNANGSLAKTLFRLSKDKSYYNRVLCPVEEPETFNFTMNTWSGIYKLDFLNKWHIRHNETPGASYQDNGFWFQTFARAQRAYFLDKKYYMNRRDNPNSSMFSSGKMYCVTEEYAFIKEWLKAAPELWERLGGIYYAKKLVNFFVTYRRLKPELQLDYLHHLYDEFLEPFEQGLIDKSFVGDSLWLTFTGIMKSPDEFYRHICVSVVMPVYNAEKYLNQALDSLLVRNEIQFEVICVDDGSTDGSLGILREYEAKDPRVRVITQENAGAGAARNNGMQYARGEYLSFLDADDFFEPDMLRRAYESALRWDSDIVVVRSDQYIEETGLYKGAAYTVRSEILPKTQGFSAANISHDVFKAFVGWPWDKLFRAEFVRNNGLRFQDLSSTDDLLFVYSAIVRAEKISTVNTVLAHHRRASGSISTTREKSWWCFYEALYALRQQLRDWGMYERYEQDFVNYCLHESLWHVMSLQNGEAYSALYNKLKTEWFATLGVLSHDGGYFYNRDEWEQLQQLMTLSADEYLFWYSQNTKDKLAASQSSLQWNRQQRAAKQKTIERLQETHKQDTACIKELKATNKTLAVKNKKLTVKNKKYRSSTSWKIGRAITWLPRKIKKVFR